MKACDICARAGILKPAVLDATNTYKGVDLCTEHRNELDRHLADFTEFFLTFNSFGESADAEPVKKAYPQPTHPLNLKS